MQETVGSQDPSETGPAANHPTFRLIQMLRAVAALLVVVHHITLMLHDRDGLPITYWLNGGVGVDLFFVISGFVITLSAIPLRHSPHPARTFLIRRIERIVPMYWIVTTVKVLLVLLAPTLAANALGTTWHVVASYLFLPSRSEPVIFAGWTLIYEMAFYVLFASILAFRASFSRVLAPLLAVIGISRWLLAFFFHANVAPVFQYYTRNTLALDFLYGILLALSLKQVRRVPSWLAIVLSIMAGCALFHPVSAYPILWRGVQWGIPAAFVIMAAIALEKDWGTKAPRWTLELGDASYCIYLTQGLALPFAGIVLAKIGTHWRGCIPVSMLLLTLFVAACGEIAYRLLEAPIMLWFKRLRASADVE